MLKKCPNLFKKYIPYVDYTKGLPSNTTSPVMCCNKLNEKEVPTQFFGLGDCTYHRNGYCECLNEKIDETT